MALYDLKVHGGPGPYDFGGKEYDLVSLYNVMIEHYTGITPIPKSFAARPWGGPIAILDSIQCQ